MNSSAESPMLIKAEFCNYEVFAITDGAKVSIKIVNRGFKINIEFSYSLEPDVKPEKDELVKDAWIKILAQLLNLQPWTIQAVCDSGNLKVRLGITKRGWLIVKEKASLTYEPIKSFERKMEHLFEINGKIFEFSPFGSIFETVSNYADENFPNVGMIDIIAADLSENSRRPFRYRIHGNPNNHESIIVDRCSVHGDGIFIGSSFTVKDIVPGSIEAAENGFRFTGITTDTTLDSMQIEKVKEITLFAPFAKP